MLVRLGATVVAVLVIVWGFVGYITDVSVERVVTRNAIDKAEHWGEYMAERVPDLDQLVATGIPTEEQQQVIRQTRQLGDIFRFKLFTAEGRLSLVSDDSNIEGPAGLADLADPEPAQVAATGQPIVEVYDGSKKPNRPDLYAEAYVPLLGRAGDVRGIVEVYVDQTATRDYFHDSFRTFAVILAGVCGLLFAVPGGAFFLQRKLAERSKSDAQFLASFDPLTGLMNRREFVARAEPLIAVGEISAVCFLDGDRFKAINDTYGHATGDRFLAHIAQVLRSNARADDLLSRFGGDEFVLALRNCDLDDVIRRARTILRESADDVDFGDATVSGTVSIGIAPVRPGQSLEDVLNHADAALYHAKSAGRNELSVYGDEMGDEMRRRTALEARLREATRKRQFEVHYQPLVDGQSREVVGYEALLRLRGEDGTAISPDVFIPVAEELGLIDEIGKWTIETATREIAARGDGRKVAVNLSAAQFRSGELVANVRDALAASGLPASCLELEITESLLLEDNPLVEFQMDALRDMGVAIAMDDFGTGFSSLSYLWKYGFDRLKIDRSFVSGLDENSARSRQIIETVLMLGDRLGMKITAEGIETQEQSDLLSELGCDVLQGYLYGRPATLAASDGAAADARKAG